MANQFHYYRLGSDNRILFGGYDAVYRYGKNVDDAYDLSQASFERLASHFFTTFPQLDGLKFSHRWGGAIDTSTRFCAFFGSARGGDIAHAAGFTGLGVGAIRFAANVLLDKIDRLDTERTRLRMVRETPPPFPPEPFAFLGIQATRWSMNRRPSRRQAQPAPARHGRPRAGVRLMTTFFDVRDGVYDVFAARLVDAVRKLKVGAGSAPGVTQGPLINTGILSNEIASFGGVKQSGFGREGSRHGIEDYLVVNISAWAASDSPQC